MWRNTAFCFSARAEAPRRLFPPAARCVAHVIMCLLPYDGRCGPSSPLLYGSDERCRRRVTPDITPACACGRSGNLSVTTLIIASSSARPPETNETNVNFCRSELGNLQRQRSSRVRLCSASSRPFAVHVWPSSSKRRPSPPMIS